MEVKPVVAAASAFSTIISGWPTALNLLGRPALPLGWPGSIPGLRQIDCREGSRRRAGFHSRAWRRRLDAGELVPLVSYVLQRGTIAAAATPRSGRSVRFAKR